MTKKKGIFRYKTNKMLLLALKYSSEVVDERVVQAIDVTDMFYDELIKIIEAGELLNININGLPTSGKSTIGFSIAEWLMRVVFNKKFGIRNISRDQMEYSIKMRDKSMSNCVEVIDEWNEMEEGGENVTVENALLSHFSDVQAQRFVHKISCSPKEAPDKNSYILLEVVQPDKVREITHCFLYYKLFKGGMEMPILLGNVNISVSNVLRKKWYLEYRRRKFEKMDLILNEGIFRPRLMEYAPIILRVCEELRSISRLGLVNKDIVGNYVKTEAKRDKIPLTILGQKLMTDECMGILTLWKSYFQVLNKYNKMKSSNKPSPNPVAYAEQVEQLKKITGDIMKSINVQLNELQKMVDIKKRYDTVLIPESKDSRMGGGKMIEIVQRLIFFVLIIVLHELGHYIAYRMYGVKPSIKLKWWGVEIGTIKQIKDMKMTEIGFVSIMGIWFGYIVIFVYSFFDFKWFSDYILIYVIMCMVDISMLLQLNEKNKKLTYKKYVENLIVEMDEI